MTGSRYLEGVRDQYEAYPFPKRDPLDEQRRLVVCELDMLAKINHYGFRGRQAFGAGFRALVAGGGTGDAAVFLAHQLKPRGGRVTYLDISRSSLEVARERARIRGLDNVEWVAGSILDLAALGLGPFDYINCAGVLHHMADPDEGLKALAGVLKDDGCMGLMVYGRYGRLDIYATQDLLRLALAGEPDLAAKVAAAKSVLGRLPANNVLMRGRDRAATLRFLSDDEPNLVDALLHAQDRAYSAAEVHDFLAGAGLSLIEFTSYQGTGGVCRLEYDPGFYLEGLPVLDRVRRLPRPAQETIAEIINGSIGLHAFWAARRQGTVADISDPAMVPFFVTSHAADACRRIVGNGAAGTTITLRFDLKLPLRLHAATLAFLDLIDGHRDMATLIRLLAERRFDGRRLPPFELAGALARDFATLNALDFLVLRHRDTPPIGTIDKGYPD